MRSKVFFISDLHLGADYITNPIDHERRVVDFLQSIESEAAELYLLGDILDYWFEYRDVVPRGFVRFFGQLARMADTGVRITWLTGNHDIWLFDYLRDEIGIEVVDAPYIERRVGDIDLLLAHGDRIGRQDFGFRLICSLFRNKFCQRLYSGIHPRWTVPFAKRWSKSSRLSDGNTDHQKQIQEIRAAGAELMTEHPSAKFLVMGHHHIPLDLPIDSDPSRRIIVLGDWSGKPSYAVLSGGNIQLH